MGEPVETNEPVVYYKIRCACRKILLQSDELPREAVLISTYHPEQHSIEFYGNTPSTDASIDAPEFSWMTRAFYSYQFQVWPQGMVTCKLQCKECGNEVGKFILREDVSDGCYAEVQFLEVGTTVVLENVRLVSEDGVEPPFVGCDYIPIDELPFL